MSRNMARKFVLINALAKMDKPSLQDLSIATQISQSTIKRQISTLRNDFAMNILFVRELTGKAGTTGYYMLMDWGIFDRSSFLTRYGEL